MKKGWYILLYHNISWEENPCIRGIGGTCPPDIFRDHLEHLNKIGNLVSISEGLGRLTSRNLTKPTFSFWFDDGLVGVRKYALPLLEKYNITGAVSISSRFWNKEEFFWRFKLSYLNYVDGIRFLRTRLRKYGYKNGMSVKNFVMDNFSESIVEEINTIFKKFTSEAERQDAFRLFETPDGLLKLKEKKWILANHTAAHYPIGQTNFIENFKNQFNECEDKYRELFREESKFWVLPFGIPDLYIKNPIKIFQECSNECSNNRYLVLVGNKMNNYSSIKEKIIFRINTPICAGSDLIRFISAGNPHLSRLGSEQFPVASVGQVKLEEKSVTPVKTGLSTMNILLISYDYPPYKGGIANVSYQMALQLNDVGENIIVVAQKTKGYKEFDRNNKFLTYRSTNIFFLRELVSILLLHYLVLRYKIDVIYILMWCRGGFATFLTSKFFNIPYIIHAHGLEFLDYKKTLFDKIKYSFLRDKYKRLIFKNARRVIAVSNYTKNIVIKSGTREDRVDVIYNGVDINRFRSDLETNQIVLKHKLNNKKILLTVSRLYEHKGHDTVIRLLPQLLKKIPNAVYLIVGSGKNRDFLELLVGKLNLQNSVIFTGNVDELSLPLYYNVCDVFILLSKERLDRAEFEGFGLVFLEANSCGKPVIGARTGGIPDAIIDGKTGYLVNPEDEQEIINKIILLLENEELAKRIGEEGRSRVIREGLMWESRVKNIQRILASELKKTRDLRPNLLLISHDYPPYKGGIANISYNVAKKLSEKEKFLVVAPAVKGDKDIDNKSNLATIRVIDIKIIREVMLFFMILYLIFKHKIEIIYNLTWYPSAAVSYFVSLLTRIPYIIQVYAMDYFEETRGIFNKLKYNWLWNFIKKRTFARAKKIITLSGFMKDRLIVRGIDALKIEVIPPGIDSARFIPHLSAKEIIAKHGLEKKKVLLTVARLDDYKGHDMVIKALPNLITKFPDITYLIIGDGPYESQLRRLVEELNLKDYVIFAGWQDALLPLYYNACDLFIMLSREVYSEAKMEGYGIVFLEASACGKPIIAGRSGGIEDAVIDGVTGLLVNPLELDEIESSITKILSDKNYADFLGTNGVERIQKERLDWYSISEKIRGILLGSKE